MTAGRFRRRLAAVLVAGAIAVPAGAGAMAPEVSPLPLTRSVADATEAAAPLLRPAPRPALSTPPATSGPDARHTSVRGAPAPFSADLLAADLLAIATGTNAARLAQTGREPAPHVAEATPETPRPLARPGSRLIAPSVPFPRPPGEAEPAARGAPAPIDLAVRPAPRPEPLGAEGRAGPAAATSLAARAAVAAVSPQAVRRSRLPRVRPEAKRREFVQRVAAVRTQPTPGAIAGRSSGNLCGIAGIEGAAIAPIAGRVRGCGVANPVRVTAVDGVRLSQSAVMDCDTARALHTWVRSGLRPAIGNRGGGPERLRVAAHYVCRTMNHRPGARISEHGRGRAIDISAIRLHDGQTLDVLRHWRHATYGPILQAAHRAACGPFNTTLGPGSDGMHEDHFHYDMRQGRRVCR